MGENMKCKAYGKDSFAVGELGHGDANIRSANKMLELSVRLCSLHIVSIVGRLLH